MAAVGQEGSQGGRGQVKRVLKVAAAGQEGSQGGSGRSRGFSRWH